MNEKSQTPTELPEPISDTVPRSLHPRIVVGIDGSPSSVATLRRGARIASALGLDSYSKEVTPW